MDRKQKQLRNDKGEVSQAERVLKAQASSQETRTVKYHDFNGKARSKKVLLTDPGAMTAMKAFNYSQAGNDTSNTIGLYELIMNDVVTEPSLSFEREDKKLPKSMKTRDITKKNADGKKVTLHFKFPDYRTAVGLANLIVRPSGAANFVETLKNFDAYIIKDSNGKAVGDDYWNAGHEGHGLAMVAMNNAGQFIADVLDHDGFASTVNEGIFFLTGTVRQ